MDHFNDISVVRHIQSFCNPKMIKLCRSSFINCQHLPWGKAALFNKVFLSVLYRDPFAGWNLHIRLFVIHKLVRRNLPRPPLSQHWQLLMASCRNCEIITRATESRLIVNSTYLEQVICLSPVIIIVSKPIIGGRDGYVFLVCHFWDVSISYISMRSHGFHEMLSKLS